MNYCSPNKQFDTTNQTCFSIEDLIAIAKAFNKWRKNICISGNVCINPNNFQKIDLNLSKGELYKELKQRLSSLCSSENCWLELDFMKSLDPEIRETLLYFTFKPKGLKSLKTWFNTTNINEIIQQYQLYINNLHNPNFYKFLGSQPSDITRVEKFNWNELRTKYNIISIIFNNDTHKEKGSHWNACFIDNTKKTVECFDSLGKLPNKYIREFLINFKDYSFTFNKFPFQTAGTNCGMYACYFTIQKLKGKTFQEITNKLTDKMMTEYRTQVFRP